MTGTGERARSAPRVGLGVTLCNRAEFLAEALDSLLAQTYRDFQLVLVDDGSTDATEGLARGYAQRDSRVRYVRLPVRQGMVAAWRTAFEQATAGGVRYFAWGSDHDRWHPRWLETLVGVLEAGPEIVMAYPLTERIGPDGAPLAKPARQFDTAGIADRSVRWRSFNRSDAVAAGDIVYGLMRADAVREAGVFRPVLCPDRLLVAELTLRGQIRQVPEVLWYRRQFAAGSIERQRSTLFAPGTTPPPAWMPPWYMHARSLRAAYVDTDVSRPADLTRDEARRLVTQYAAAYAWRHYAKSSVRRGLLAVLGWPRWIYKRLKHAVLLGVYGVLVTLRRLGVTPLVEWCLGRTPGDRRGSHP
jgi:glycosyltransferase involved in cell wall biosynthesis